LAAAALAAALAACLARFFLLFGFPAGGFGPRAGAPAPAGAAPFRGLRLLRTAASSRAGRSSVVRVSSRFGFVPWAGFVPGLGFLTRGFGASFQSTGVVVPGETDVSPRGRAFGADRSGDLSFGRAA
jgi:hypothetical protein